jgi:hypothetical protein
MFSLFWGTHMNPRWMKAALAGAFDEPTRSIIVETLDDAYQVASMRYDESVGCNPFTFGTDLYHFAKFRFQGCGDRADAPITLGDTSSELELRLRVRGFNVACHRVGAFAADNIEDCFPSSTGGPAKLARLNAMQLELDLEWTEPRPLPKNVVIAHLGNPTTGLEAVYLAVPDSVSDAGRIDGWAYTELLWIWDGEQTDGFPVADLPPEVPIDAASVELRQSTEETEASS